MEDIIERVARMARLNLSDEEKTKFGKEFSQILEHFTVLEKIKTKERPAYHHIEIKNKTRSDMPEKSLSQKEALSNTKHKKNGYFKGPGI